MALTQYDAPGFADDLSPALKTKWSDQMSAWVTGESDRLGSNYKDYFFNEILHPEAATGAVAAITWEGFPKHWNIEEPHNNVKKWQASEKLYTQGGVPFRYQDEYLEWRSVKKDGKLVKVIFTCEGPEYWDFIAQNDKNLLLNLYRKYVDPAVKIADLFKNNSYYGSNKWNTTDGILHLTHPANTLGAEINLAAQATILRKKGATDPITDPGALISCSKYGEETRFSDPAIGANVNSFVRQGHSVTLNNPIGLYIHKLNTAGIQIPAGLAIGDFWKVIRGDSAKGMILRAEFAVPAGSNISLEDITIGGVALQYGAQLAELIEMVIYGKAYKIMPSVPKTIDCGVSPQQTHLEMAALTFVAKDIAVNEFPFSEKYTNNRNAPIVIDSE